MTLGVGDVVDGRFRLEECVGSGGYGDVFRATQISLERTVAIKLVHAHLANRVDVAKRFRREALLTSKLDHRNAVRVLDFGDHEGTLYIAMEFAPGVTLKQALAAGPCTPERTRRLGLQIAGALSAAHAIELMHRDLKPSNVLLVGEGESERAVVIDFGLVKAFFDDADATMITQTDVMIGTPTYMSPETVKGVPQDGRADLFSLGVLLHEMLTGRRPYKGTTPLEAAMARLTQPAEPLPDTVPGYLRALVEGLLQIEPRDRPQTAERVVELLKERRVFASSDAAAEAPTVLLGRDGETPTVLLARDSNSATGPGLERDPARAHALHSDATVAPSRGPVLAPTLPAALPARSAQDAAPAQRGPVELAPTSGVRSTRYAPSPNATFSWRAFAVAIAALATLLALVFIAPWQQPAETPQEQPAAVSPTATPPTATLNAPEPPGANTETPSGTAATTAAEPNEGSSAESGAAATGPIVGAAAEPGAEPDAAPSNEPAVAPSTEPAADATGSEAAPAEPEERPRTSRRPRGTGTMTINADPYGLVFIDGERIGDSPVVRVEVAAGTHDVLIQYLDQSREERVTVRADEHTTVTHRFR